MDRSWIFTSFAECFTLFLESVVFLTPLGLLGRWLALKILHSPISSWQMPEADILELTNRVSNMFWIWLKKLFRLKVWSDKFQKNCFRWSLRVNLMMPKHFASTFIGHISASTDTLNSELRLPFRSYHFRTLFWACDFLQSLYLITV